MLTQRLQYSLIKEYSYGLRYSLIRGKGVLESLGIYCYQPVASDKLVSTHAGWQFMAMPNKGLEPVGACPRNQISLQVQIVAPKADVQSLHLEDPGKRTQEE